MTFAEELLKAERIIFIAFVIIFAPLLGVWWVHRGSEEDDECDLM